MGVPDTTKQVPSRSSTSSAPEWMRSPCGRDDRSGESNVMWGVGGDAAMLL